MTVSTERLYVKVPTELIGCYEVREASLEDYKKMIPGDLVLQLAQDYLFESKVKGDALESPEMTKQYLQAKYGMAEREKFAVLHLTNKHQVICEETLFEGTIDSASVYPREVVRSALLNGSNALILVHNHPSGCAEPSQADRRITRRLIDALQTVDIRVLDHIVVGKGESVSFAERGWI